MATPFGGQAETVVKFTLTAAQWTAQSDHILDDNEIGVESDTGKKKWGDGSTAWSSLGYSNDEASELAANKDASGGYVGLTLLKHNFYNVLGTFKSFFTNANTAARTYTFPDRTGTIADDTDLALKAPLASPTFTGTVSGITKTMVGLGSADNTADTAKPVSTAQQTALDLKAPIASPTFTGTLTVPATIVGTAIPTTDPHVAGRVWANSGVVTVSAG